MARQPVCQPSEVVEQLERALKVLSNCARSFRHFDRPLAGRSVDLAIEEIESHVYGHQGARDKCKGK